MNRMESQRPRSQFTIRSLFWATAWSGVWFSLLKLTLVLKEDFYSASFELWQYSSCVVIIAAVIGLIRRAPVCLGMRRASPVGAADDRANAGNSSRARVSKD